MHLNRVYCILSSKTIENVKFKIVEVEWVFDWIIELFRSDSVWKQQFYSGISTYQITTDSIPWQNVNFFNSISIQVFSIALALRISLVLLFLKHVHFL